MRSGLTAMALLLAAALTGRAADSAEMPDTLGVGRGVPVVAAGVLSAGIGLAGHAATPQMSAVAPQMRDPRSTPVADVAQFVPLAFPWVMKAFGAETRSGWGRMAVSQAFGAIIVTGATEALKNTVTSRRPDGSDWHSFPSGHTARAFLGATAGAIELSGRSPWYAAGAYTFATAVAVSRVVDNRHFPADVVAGAGIGIVSAQLGYWLGDVIFGRRQLNAAQQIYGGGAFSAGLTTGLTWELGRQYLAGHRVKTAPGLEAALNMGWKPARHTELIVRAAMRSAFLIDGETLDRRLDAVELTPGVRFGSDLCGGLWRVDATVACGVRYNLPASDSSLGVEPWAPTGRVEAGMGLRLHGNLGVRASLGYELTRRALSDAAGATTVSAISSLTAGLTATVAF